MRNIPILTVPDGKELGKWAGLCKYDKKGDPRRVVRCSSVAIKEYGEETEHFNFLKDYVNKQVGEGAEGDAEGEDDQ
jgi:small subunit ribosomal protein S12e